jgi:DNA-binding MarR family transcriptional regulator
VRVRAGGYTVSSRRKSITDLLNDAEYEALAKFRYALRQFLKFSVDAASAVGLETLQYQALLALRGRPGHNPLSVGELAEELQIQHHGAVQLVTRLAKRSLVERQKDAADKRRVLIVLTPEGQSILSQLAWAHKSELKRAVPAMELLLRRLNQATRFQ